jgi:hypothetical protein
MEWTRPSSEGATVKLLFSSDTWRFIMERERSVEALSMRRSRIAYLRMFFHARPDRIIFPAGAIGLTIILTDLAKPAP